MCLCFWLVAQLSPIHCHPMNCKPTSLLWPWGFPRQECWIRLPCSTTRDLSNPKMEFLTGLLWLLYCSQILYRRVKINLGYMTHTLNWKILSRWKGKMVRTKHLYLPTNNKKNSLISICLCLCCNLFLHWRMIAVWNFLILWQTSIWQS